MSQAYSPCFCGVFTQTKWTSPNSPTSSQEVVKRSRPRRALDARRHACASSSSSPGSYIGTLPAESISIFSGTTSSPSTSKPSSAMAAAWVAPR